MVLTAKEALVITPSGAFARESTRFACISSANNASMKSWVYLNSAFLLRAAIGFSRRVTSAAGRLLFFQSVFNLSLHIMHLFPSDRPPSILFAKKFRIHDSFIAASPQKMRGTLRFHVALLSGERVNSAIARHSAANLLNFSVEFIEPSSLC